MTAVAFAPALRPHASLGLAASQVSFPPEFTASWPLTLEHVLPAHAGSAFLGISLLGVLGCISFPKPWSIFQPESLRWNCKFRCWSLSASQPLSPLPPSHSWPSHAPSCFLPDSVWCPLASPLHCGHQFSGGHHLGLQTVLHCLLLGYV